MIADNDPDALDLLDLGKGRDGTEAIDLCRELRPNVLVVDFRMPPGPNGADVVEALKDQPDLHMIVYTNYRDPKQAARARALGAAWLLKGDLPTLRKALRVISAH